MDSESLATFVEVHRSGGFSNAAETLGRSQPAISRRIALLEQSVGAPLFERTASGVTLSLAGQVLLPHAERVLAALKDAREAVAKEAGAVSLAVVGTLADTRLPGLLARFAASNPGLDLSIRTATSNEVSDLVRRGEAAIGLRYRTGRAPDLKVIPLAPEPMIVVCAPAHPLAGKRTPRLADLAAETWLAFADSQGPGEPAGQSILAQFHVRGIGDVAWRPVDSLTAQKRLAEAGFGVVLLAESAVREELARGSLAAIAVGDLEAVNPVSAIIRREGYLSVAAQALLALLQEQEAWA